jgi:Uma2 family endonuclease
MAELQTKIPSDTWFVASWDDYIQTVEDSSYEKAKCYYNQGRARVEMSPVGNNHASDHAIISYAIYLFAATKGIDLNGKDCCSYRKIGIREVQPDLSFYVGENAEIVPWETSIIDLNAFPAPDLVIEVANTSLADDIGEKRLLYEDIGVKEYWIVNVQKVKIIAFAVENGGSRRIANSQVLPGLAISVLEKALQRTRQMNHSRVAAWLLAQFQQD